MLTASLKPANAPEAHPTHLSQANHLRYRTSSFLRYVPALSGNRTFVYHTLFGNPRVFNDHGIRFLRLFAEPVATSDLSAEVEGDPSAILDELLRIHFIVSEGTDERALFRIRRDELLARIAAAQTIDHISLSISENCNFGCKHCMFYQSDSHGSSLPIYQKEPRELNMSWPTAKACVDTYISLLRVRGDTHARIHFGNAEPLMNWPLVAQILDYCEEVPGLSFEFAINTNLSLLNRQKAETLKRHGVKIATSLDGIGEANDAIRTTRTGKGTFALILAKIDLLESISYPLDGVSITVTSKNFQSVDTEVIDFAAARRMTSLAFDYDLVGFSTIGVEERVAKILKLKTYANSKGIYFGGTWYSPFRKIMTTSMLDRSHAFCAAIEGRALVFNPDGSLKTCGYTTTQVGHMEHLDEVFGESGGLARLARDRYPGADPYCHGCMIEGPCGGQCHSTWEAARRGSLDLFGQMCVFYRSVSDALIQDYLSALDEPEALELRVRYL